MLSHAGRPTGYVDLAAELAETRGALAQAIRIGETLQAQLDAIRAAAPAETRGSLAQAVAVVFDIESSPPMPLGLYVRTNEDEVIYTRPTGVRGYAPADCVTVRWIDPIAPQVTA